MIKQQLFIGAALIAGVAVGYFMKGDAPVSRPEAKPAQVREPARRDLIADVGGAASNAALRRRVAELERQLASLAVEMSAAPSNAVATSGVPTEGERRHRSPREMMEEMKKKDPQRFAQMTNRMARFFQHRQRRTQQRMEFLSSVDTSTMGSAAKKTHDRYQQLLAQKTELEENLHDPDLDDETRHELFDKMRQVDSDLRSTRNAERKNLFGETAKSLGLSGSDADALTETLEQVVDATNDGRGMMPPPPDGAQPPDGAAPRGAADGRR